MLNNIYEIQNKTPKLHNKTYWEKLPNNDYYIKNDQYNSFLIVSEYVISFLKLATGVHSIKQICELNDLSPDEYNINKVHELYYITLYPIGVLKEEKIKIKIKKSYIKYSLTILSQKKVIFFSSKLNFLFKKKNCFHNFTI